MKDIEGKTILITGGAGTIGSELCNSFLSRFSSVRIIVLDISDNNIVLLKERLRILSNCDYYVGDVNDKQFLNYIFNLYSVDILIHCAAYKQVTLMQSDINLYSLIKNNLESLINIMDVSKEFSVEKFLFISSDKAVYPTSYMGMTKRLGEILISYENNLSNFTSFCSLRFGNIWDSNASLLSLFQTQWRYYKKIFITDKNAFRYFILKKEIFNYVLESLLDNQNSLFVGEYTRKKNIADIGIEFLNSKEIKDLENHIEYMGLRDGEKIDEELSYEYEILSELRGSNLKAVTNPLISEDIRTHISDILKFNILNESRPALTKLNQKSEVYFN